MCTELVDLDDEVSEGEGEQHDEAKTATAVVGKNTWKRLREQNDVCAFTERLSAVPRPPPPQLGLVSSTTTTSSFRPLSAFPQVFALTQNLSCVICYKFYVDAMEDPAGEIAGVVEKLTMADSPDSQRATIQRYLRFNYRKLVC